MKGKICILGMFLILLVSSNLMAGSDFYAYHTKVQHSSTDYMSKYADIIVVLGEGRQLEFTRRTMYQPLWRTSTGSYLIDDFYPGRDKDFDFNYTYVRLIENTPDKIVVHWRTIPDIETLEKADAEKDPLTLHGFLGVVHELFTIYSDGRVERIVKDAKNTLSSQWADPGMAIRQTLYLKEDGIEHGAVDWGRPGKDDEEDEEEDEGRGRKNRYGNPIIDTEKLPEPIRKWTFDDGIDRSRRYVKEHIEEEWSRVEGLMALYKKGVSGTALVFDGYYTGLEVEESFPEIKNEFSIDTWVALDVYPYNEAPFIHQSRSFGQKGFYFGVDPYGYPFFRLHGQEVKSRVKIPLYKWQYLAVTAGKGKITLYQNNELTASAKFKGKINLIEAEPKIGLNTEKARCTDYVRGFPQNLPFIFGIQGVMDELNIYDRVLSKEDMTKIYTAFLPEDDTSPIAVGVLPGEIGVAEDFGAHYKTLPFQESWDNMWRLSDYADVVVKFDHIPTSVIYWHGSNYAANWITDKNQWMSDQSSEIWGPHGCSEHMADKQLRHSYARIIENTPARTVIHWRYPCVDVAYVCTDRRNWSDEYHTIYPDGTGIRKVVWNKGYNQPGFQDIQFFTNPGETALDVVDMNAMTLANLDGQIHKMVWAKPNKIPRNTLRDAKIQHLNTKSKYKIFVAYQGGTLGAWGRNEQSKYTDDPFAGPWNHWPMHFVPSDGRFAVDHDRVTHFALGANDSAPEFGSVVMYGFTDRGVTSTIPAARSWINPPEVHQVKGADYREYDKAQKAFLFDAKKKVMSFSIKASEKSPVVNPCFVVKHWNSGKKASVTVDGRKTDGKSIRQGIQRDTDGTQTLIVWMDKVTESSMTVTISR